VEQYIRTRAWPRSRPDRADGGESARWGARHPDLSRGRARGGFRVDRRPRPRPGRVHEQL